MLTDFGERLLFVGYYVYEGAKFSVFLEICLYDCKKKREPLSAQITPAKSMVGVFLNIGHDILFNACFTGKQRRIML
jgi:hypothetical protein